MYIGKLSISKPLLAVSQKTIKVNSDVKDHF